MKKNQPFLNFPNLLGLLLLITGFLEIIDQKAGKINWPILYGEQAIFLGIIEIVLSLFCIYWGIKSGFEKIRIKTRKVE